MMTFRELAIEYATKQPRMIDQVTEEAPILDMLPFWEASHALWNVYEEVEEITGASFVDLDEPLSQLEVQSELKKRDLNIMGGYMEVGEDKAQAYGGKEKYFAKRMPILLKQAGMDAEYAILYNNVRQYCIDNGLTTDAGGSGYSIILVRFSEQVTGGLYSPEGFKQGALLDLKPINGGNLYKSNSGAAYGSGQLVYGARLKNYFGFQIADDRTIHTIVNIDSSNVPSADAIDNAISAVRGTPANTFLFLHPKCKTFLNTYKGSALQTNVRDKDFNRLFDSWDEIPLVTSYNFLEGTEAAV